MGLFRRRNELIYLSTQGARVLESTQEVLVVFLLLLWNSDCPFPVSVFLGLQNEDIQHHGKWETVMKQRMPGSS